MSCSLQDFQSQYLRRINAELERCLPTAGASPKLQEAMRYSVLNGGKRVRPLLTYATAKAIGAINQDTDLIASAVELVHAYSLIHDDLPAMDDDDLRRGSPTCHIAFDEATAILAGDALQALAFEQLSRLQSTSPSIAVKMIAELARAAGAPGMVAGQAIDLAAVDQPLTLPQLEQMHSLKTGAMIRVSVRLAAMAGSASTEQLDALTQYSEAIGLAFQVQDDILDVESSTEVLGKPQGADMALNKPTYSSLLGLDSAKQKLADLHRSALDALANFDDRAEPLRAIANYIVSRNH